MTKRFDLNVSGAAVPVIIQPDFTDGYDLGVTVCQIFEVLKGAFIEFCGIMRVDTDRGINVGMLPCLFHPGARAGNHTSEVRSYGFMPDGSSTGDVSVPSYIPD